MKDEYTFYEDGKKYYQMISEERIREIVREEIVLYNETFMSALTKEESVTEN